MRPKNNYYVYLYRVDGIERYVGKGKGDRDQYHLWNSRQLARGVKSDRYYAVHHKIAANLGADIVVSRIAEGLTEDEAFEQERVYVKKWRSTLWNRTGGGDGVGGLPLTPEHREKIRRALTGRKRSELELTNIKIGIRKSIEAGNRLSYNKGKYTPLPWHEKRRREARLEAHKLRLYMKLKADLEKREARGFLRAFLNSEEGIRFKKESRRILMSGRSGFWKGKVSHFKGKKHSEETRQKFRDAWKSRRLTPVSTLTRQRMREAALCRRGKSI